MARFSSQVERWRYYVERAFGKENADAALWVISKESSGNPKARNKSSNATGLFQILPSQHGNRNWTDPKTNIDYAAQLFKSQGWKPWGGEGNTYRGKPFGAIGVAAANGDLPPDLFAKFMGGRAAAREYGAPGPPRTGGGDVAVPYGLEGEIGPSTKKDKDKGGGKITLTPGGNQPGYSEEGTGRYANVADWLLQNEPAYGRSARHAGRGAHVGYDPVAEHFGWAPLSPEDLINGMPIAEYRADAVGRIADLEDRLTEYEGNGFPLGKSPTGQAVFGDVTISSNGNLNVTAYTEDGAPYALPWENLPGGQRLKSDTARLRQGLSYYQDQISEGRLADQESFVEYGRELRGETDEDGGGGGGGDSGGGGGDNGEEFEPFLPVEPIATTALYGPTDEPLDSPYNGYEHFNKGWDASVTVGTPVRTPVEGDVVIVTDQGKKGWGLRVVVRDDTGAHHNFGHLSKADVKLGDRVERGQVIAKSGNSGASTGPHLSYDVMVDGKYVDPSPWLGFHAAGDNREGVEPDAHTKRFDSGPSSSSSSGSGKDAEDTLTAHEAMMQYLELEGMKTQEVQRQLNDWISRVNTFFNLEEAEASRDQATRANWMEASAAGRELGSTAAMFSAPTPVSRPANRRLSTTFARVGMPKTEPPRDYAGLGTSLGVGHYSANTPIQIPGLPSYAEGTLTNPDSTANAAARAVDDSRRARLSLHKPRVEQSVELEKYIEAHRELAAKSEGRPPSIPSKKSLRVGTSVIPPEILKRIGQGEIPIPQPSPEMMLMRGETW